MTHSPGSLHEWSMMAWHDGHACKHWRLFPGVLLFWSANTDFMGSGSLCHSLKALTWRCGITIWPVIWLPGDLWWDLATSPKGTWYQSIAWNNSKKEDTLETQLLSLWSWFLLRMAARVSLLWWVRCPSGHECQSHSQGWWHARAKCAGVSAGRTSACPWLCVPALVNAAPAWHPGKLPV